MWRKSIQKNGLSDLERPFFTQAWGKNLQFKLYFLVLSDF